MNNTQYPAFGSKGSKGQHVVKNIIIQNSNLQNCNVYIGSGPDANGQIQIVPKDKDADESHQVISPKRQKQAAPQ